MSASEKLKSLEASDESPATDMLIVWDALPQIVAVVEAAERLESECADFEGATEATRAMTWNALADLDEALP